MKPIKNKTIRVDFSPTTIDLLNKWKMQGKIGSVRGFVQKAVITEINKVQKKSNKLPF